LELDFQAVEFDEPRHKARGWNPRGFRSDLCDLCGLAAYDVASPTELAGELRSERWQLLCDRVDAFASLAPSTQERVAWLLLRLGFEDSVLALVPAQADSTLAASEDAAALVGLRTFVRYAQSLDGQCPDYSLDEFERIARLAAPGRPRLDALYHLVEQNAKFRGDVEACEHWQSEHLRQLQALEHTVDEITYQAALSRYHRVGGFIPQLKRDQDGVAAEMDAAEEAARSVSRDTFAGVVLSDSSLVPVIESRLREALWIGDLEAAQARAEQGTTVAPTIATSWQRLGEVSWQRDQIDRALDAFRRSAMLAPPARSYSMFMVGQCHEDLDDPQSARDAYVAALRADPWSVSAAERLRIVADQSGDGPLARWVESHLTKLHRMAEATPAPGRHPYQLIAPPTESVAAR
jgi:tetratricopeptide (TPR) repeat protein